MLFFSQKNCKLYCVLYMFEKDHVFLLPYPVKRMVEMGKEILQKNNVTDLSDVRWDTFTVNSSSR